MKPEGHKYPHKMKADWNLLGQGKSTETLRRNMSGNWTIKWNESLQEYEEIENGDDINISSKSKGDLDYLKERHMKYKSFFTYLNEDENNKLVGGEGDATAPSDVNTEELSMGLAVEMEHTNDQQIATEIALDHLSTDPHYYTKLDKAGLTDEFKNVSPSGYGDPKAAFNQEDRLGNAVTCAAGNNIVGTIGKTPDGHVSGKRDSTPIVDKGYTLDINV